MAKIVVSYEELLHQIKQIPEQYLQFIKTYNSRHPFWKHRADSSLELIKNLVPNNHEQQESLLLRK